MASARWDTTGTANVIGKEYFVRQAAILFGLAKQQRTPRFPQLCWTKRLILNCKWTNQARRLT